MVDIGVEVVQWAVPVVLGGVSGWLMKTVKYLRSKAETKEQEEKERMDALCDGMRSLLRCEIIRQHESHVVNHRPMTLSDREYLTKTYDSYHVLGGNGTGTQLYNELMNLEITSV